MAKIVMKKLNGMIWFIKTSLVLFLTLAASLIMDGGACRPSQIYAAGVATITACNGCHGYTAAFSDGTARNNPAGQFQGSHNKHVIGQVVACSVCHVTPATTTTADNGHSNGQVRMSATISGGTYSKASPFAVSNTFTPGTCSATYCHGTGTLVTWGAASLACNSCHSANNSLPGAHQIHVQTATVASSYSDMSGNVSSATAYRFSCAACHSPLKGSVHANGPANINGPAEVFFGFTTATLKGGVYNYGGLSAGTDPTGAFSYTAGGGNAASCNNTYCHSNGQGANGKATVNWGTAVSSGTCVQCHDTKQTGVTATSLSGKHDAHMNPTNNPSLGLGNGFNCIECHAKTVSGNTVVSDKTKHVNKFIDYSGMKAGSSSRYSTATKLCNNIYCHSNGNPGAIVYVNPPAWNSATTYACNGCHGTSNPTTGAPDYVNGGAVPSTTANSHSKHVSALNITTTTGCSACHVKTVNGSVANRFKDYSAAIYHLNGTPNVIFNTAQAGSSAAYVPATGACNLVACHSNGKGAYPQTPIWGQATNCGYCHPIASLSVTHAKHIDLTQTPAFYTYTANRSAGDDATGKYNFGCSSCHPLTPAQHTTGPILIDFRPSVAGVGTLRVKNSALITAGSVVAGTANSGTTGTSGTSVKCLNIYCHSNGYTTTPVYATTPDWYGGVFAGDRCGNCHGNSPNSTIAGSPAHYNTNFIGTGTTSGHVVGIHYNDISNGATGEATAGTGTTNSHGNSLYSSTMNCDTCHYATVTSAANDKNMICTTCHNGTQATLRGNAAIANKAFHVSGSANVAFNPIAFKSKAQVRQFSFLDYSGAFTRPAGYKVAGSYDQAKGVFNTATMYNSGSKTCSNIACHNGQTVVWTATSGATSCSSCHNSL